MNRANEMTPQNDCIYTDKLTIGDSIKYKDLCLLLDQPVYKGGNQKKKQLEVFSRYFAYEKDGVRYIITDIYDEPLKDIHKYPANTLYTELIEKILLQYLAGQPGYKAYISPIQLWYKLGMINGYYLKYKNELKSDLIKINPTMTMFEINDFYKRCRSKFSNIISSSLKSLQDQRLIEYHYIARIGIEYSNGKIEYYDADEEQEKEIIKVERQVLLELGLNSMKQIGFSKLTKQFYDKTTQIFREEYGWDHVYRFYKIIYNQDDVIDAITNEELNSKMKTLNDRIIKALNDNAAYNYDKAGIDSEYIQDQILENDSLPSDIFYYPLTYVDKQAWLANTLIKINKSNDLTESIDRNIVFPK